VQQGLTFVEAIQKYTILTIGDGLVSQIPALLIATSAGIVVTKGGSKLSMDNQMKNQLFSNPRALGTVAGAVLLFAIIPGMPTIPFLLVGLVLGGSGFAMYRAQKREPELEMPTEVIEQAPTEEKIEEYLQVDPIEIEIGYGLISLVDENQGGTLFQKIASTRKYLALEYGILIPPVRVRDNLQLNPNDYIIKIKGNIVTNYEIYSDRFLAMNPGNIPDQLAGIPTTDPAFNLEAYWVTMEEKEKAELLGFTVVDSISVLSTHLQETIKKHFDKILSRQSVKMLLENLKKDYPAVIEDINPEALNLGTIQKVLQNLLKELIPIKDLVQIVEALIDYSKATKNVDVLTEYVRHALADTIGNLYRDQNGVVHAVGVGEKLEQNITTALQKQKEAIQTLGLSPNAMMDLNRNIQEYMSTFRNLGYIPIFLTSATIRPYFYRLLVSSFPDIVVLSYTELPVNLDIEFIGKLEI
ncbi:partial Flagellar biosynthesis protein FlhA, partial [Candidatus Brocadiaceae bacterium]